MPTTRISATVLAVFLFVLYHVTPSVGQVSNYDDFSARIDSLFARESTPDTPGAAVVITEQGETVYKRCFGLANLEHKIRITNETVFNLASVSKQFTAMAVLLLEQKAMLGLDDDIHNYFPELPDYGTTVTLRHLLHHTSGLWEYSKTFRYYAGFKPADYTSVEDVLAMLKGMDQLLFEPGSQWQYCNTNYALLGELVARVTGVSLASWTKKHIFEPLEMKSTFFQDDCFRVIPHRASCYYETDGYFKNNPRHSDVAGPSYLYSSIDDMALWLDNFRHHTVGGDSLIEGLFQKNVLNDGSESFYGYGLGVSEHDGKTVIDHSGQTGSFKTMTMYVREDELGIVILANNGRIQAERLAYQILDLYYGEEAEKEGVAQTPEPEPFISLDSIDTEGYGGAYLIAGDQGVLFLSRQTNSLYGIFDGLGSDFFYPVSDSEFATIRRNVRFYMRLDDDHKPSRLMLDLKGDTMWADRVDEPMMTPEQLAANYAGTYYCDALDIAYHLIVDDDRLVIQHRRYDDRPLQATDKDEFVGSIGIVRFSRNVQGAVDGLRVSDEDTNFKPLSFRRVD